MKTRTVQLSDVCEINPCTDYDFDPEFACSFVPMEAVDDVDPRIAKSVTRPFRELAKGYTPFAENDVIVAKITPCVENGKCAIARNLRDGVAFGSTEFLVLRATKHVTPEWLFYFWRYPPTRRLAVINMTGSAGQKRVPERFLETLKIPLPDLPEQRRIAGRLEQADRLRRTRRYALQLTDTFLPAAFLELFGDPVANPKRWKKAPFEEVAPSRLGKMLDANQRTGKYGRPYLRNENVQWDRFDLTDISIMDFDAEDREEFLLAPGDLMICEGGEPGRCAIWRGELPECCFQKALHRARPVLSKVIPEYLVHLLWSLARRGGLADHVTSATIAHLTGEKLKLVPIPVPPLPLQ